MQGYTSTRVFDGKRVLTGDVAVRANAFAKASKERQKMNQTSKYLVDRETLVAAANDPTLSDAAVRLLITARANPPSMEAMEWAKRFIDQQKKPEW